MQTRNIQLTLYLPDDQAQPAVALPKPDRPRVKELSLREAALQYLGELPDAEKPVNRLLHYGAGALATDELLACVFGQNGHGHADAQHLLSAFEGLPGLAQATVLELQTHPGIGPARAAQVKAALELGRRLLVAAPHERPMVRQPADAVNLLMAEMSLLSQEHLRTVLLDTRNRVIAIPTVYIGSLNMAAVRIGEVFREAIRANCAAIIVIHNHPSGDPTPSPEDVQVTRQIVEAGSLMNIDVLDHLIIGRQRFVSMKERGLGFIR
jgi:DNA repair protein RadC